MKQYLTVADAPNWSYLLDRADFTGETLTQMLPWVNTAPCFNCFTIPVYGRD